jgi:hypothetical protein
MFSSMRFMSGRRVLFAAALAVLAGLLAIVSLTASAHEQRPIGDYTLVFGWRVEPAVTGYPNGPEVFIRLPEGAEGDINDVLADVEVSLQVDVSFGPASRTIDLRREFRTVDHFIADLIPTLPGDYTFRVYGNIGDVAVDETFTSADGLFGTVEPSSDIMFPEPYPDLTDLLARIEALEAQVAELSGE